MGCEFELKYAATEEALEAARALAEHWQTIAMETTYYDDPLHRLSSRKWTLRRRLENGVSVCTLKTPLPDGSRGEWELPCQDIGDAIEGLLALGAPSELAELADQGLTAACGARFTRQAALVSMEDAVVELALDQGILFGGGRELPLTELEVELKSGSRAAAAAYAAAIAHIYRLSPQPLSKSARAMGLIKG